MLYKKIKINNKDEILNVLATISSYITNPSQDVEVNGFKIDYDINTWQHNKLNRFEVSLIPGFMNEALNIQNILSKEILP